MTKNKGMLEDNISIDWLEYTLLKPTSSKEALEKIDFKKDTFIKLKTGLNGYKNREVEENSGVIFLSDGTDDMGEHVIISGKSCRYLDNNHVEIDLLAKALAVNRRINITRLDLALDIYNKNLFKKCLKAYKKNNFVSKFRTTKLMETKKDGKEKGGTIYFGSRSSEVMIRIYDKGAEQKKEIDWTRIEIVFKKEYAKDILINRWQKTWNELFKGILTNYLNFVDKKELNISRSKKAKFWNDIVENIEKIKLYKMPEATNLEDIKAWLKEQVSTSLFTVSEAEESTKFIKELMIIGGNNAKEKHWNLIEKEQEKRRIANEQR